MKIKDGFIKRDIGNKTLVVTTGELSKTNNIMIELNHTSSFIWDCIADGLDAEQTANKMLTAYDITYEKALDATNKVIDMMKQNNIFE